MGRRRGTVGLDGGRRGRQPRSEHSLQELEKAGKPVVPSSLEKEPSPEDPFRASDLQSG